MTLVVALLLAVSPLQLACADSVAIRKIGLLELQRRPAAFAGPASPPELNLQGFCKRIECKTPPCKPVCSSQPCCCWSTFAAEVHPAYPSPDETASKQECLYAPKGFRYAPEPGLSYDDGYSDALKAASLPTYAGRRLCCLRRKPGVQDESQQDLRMAVKTTTTGQAVVVTTAGVPEPGELNAAFTTETFTTSILNPGDEYENAQVEMAARAHLAAAEELTAAVSSLNNSATAIQEVNDILQTDPNLVRSRKHVAQMKKAIAGWAGRRWENLNKLKEASR